MIVLFNLQTNTSSQIPTNNNSRKKNTLQFFFHPKLARKCSTTPRWPARWCQRCLGWGKLLGSYSTYKILVITSRFFSPEVTTPIGSGKAWLRELFRLSKKLCNTLCCTCIGSIRLPSTTYTTHTLSTAHKYKWGVHTFILQLED